MSKQKYPQSSVSSGGVTKEKKTGRANYTHAKADARKNRRRDEAEARQFKYDNLSTAEKLKGLGATGSNSQRTRLQALLAKEKAPAVKQAPLTSAEKGVKLVKNVQAAVAATART